MREQLIKYVELLFAGTPESDDIRQEILQNTLDRYDDLIDQGKTPEAAYRLAIAGIGDVGEILGAAACPSPVPPVCPSAPAEPEVHSTPMWKKILRAAAVFLYIICVIPLFILSEMGMDTIGLCATISIAAVATVAIIMSGNGKADEDVPQKSTASEPTNELYKAYKSLSGVVTLVIYLGISFWSGAWYITWLVFPISGAIDGIVKAIFDLKEAK